MKQKLLTDIELDVHELKLLMNTFSKEPTMTLSELLKRSILRMQERLEQLSEEISAVPVEASPSPVAEAESEVPIVEEQAPCNRGNRISGDRRTGRGRECSDRTGGR